VAALAGRIELAARVYRHARALARDVSDVHVHDERLASATRDLADATDRALTQRDADEPLRRAEATLSGTFEGEAWLVATQLGQLRTDITAALPQPV
jgi:Ser/Thr protein kinase RdoA (MazF antagonist)